MPLPLPTEALFDHVLIYTASIFLVTPLSGIVGDRKGEDAVQLVPETTLLQRLPPYHCDSGETCLLEGGELNRFTGVILLEFN
jgi:hypothetical protein